MPTVLKNVTQTEFGIQIKMTMADVVVFLVPRKIIAKNVLPVTSPGL